MKQRAVGPFLTVWCCHSCIVDLGVGVSPTAQAAPLCLSPQGSSSSDSLEGQSCDYASKSYDAVVFDVLKVSPEEFAVSNGTDVSVWAPKRGVMGGWQKQPIHPVVGTVGYNILCEILSSIKKTAINLELTTLKAMRSIYE